MPTAPGADLAPFALEVAHFTFRSRAMTVLLGWAVLQIAAGALGAALGRRPTLRIFFGANAAWNLVNLAIALGGLASARAHVAGSLDAVGLAREVAFFQNVLLVNVGLDVGYVATGIVLGLWGRDRGDAWRAPVGAALGVQGVFLLGFDIVLATLAAGHLAEAWAALRG